MIKIPFSFLPPQVLKRWSKKIEGISQRIKSIYPGISLEIKHAQFEVTDREYIGMCLISSFMIFVFFFVFSFLILSRLVESGALNASFLIALAFFLFILFQQFYYPRLIVSRRVRGLEKNLMPVLQNILIQINSGVPLFDTLVHISAGGYGEVSTEVKKAVKAISAGEEEIRALESLASNNPSVFFRRSIWQLVNGMKAGGDIANVIGDVIENLGEEQLIAIQKYGSQLNPLAMFYMLIAVILPSLGITFIIILSSFISLSQEATQAVFFGLYGFVLFFQIMFIGTIKARRPALMS